ncbi:MAG: hypothetical protein K1X95_02210 [Acidimicrobiia bacterium]|nr:hypothetical protein [Acidimicrobiia bacterium]
MGRLSTSWKLMKQSWAVLRGDKELMVFPIVSAIASLVVVASFMVPVVLAVMSTNRGAAVQTGSTDVPLWVYPVMFVFYVVLAIVTIYCNSALMGAAMVRLRGGDPTLADGFGYANRHLPQILGWALISATVGMVLRSIQQRSGLVGRLVVGLIGAAWQFVTYFVVPVLIFEDAGPVQAVKRSALIVRQRWGEQIAGTVGIGFVSGLLSLIGVGLIAGGAAAGVATRSAVLGAGLVVLGVVYLVALTIVTQAMQGIYNTALYRFATEGTGGGVFSDADLAGTFRTKDGRVPPIVPPYGHGPMTPGPPGASDPRGPLPGEIRPQ